MNKKPLLIIIITASLLWIILSWIIYTQTSSFDAPAITDIKEPVSQIEIESTTQSIHTAESIQEKIKNIKKKLALKWLIAKWNENIQEQEYNLALTKYLKLYKDLPTDSSIINKLWEIYFYLHKYPQSYRYFEKIVGSTKLNYSLAFESLLLSEEVKLENRNIMKEKIEAMGWGNQQQFYYQTSLLCYHNYSECKQSFEDSIENNGTGSVFASTKNIQDAFIHYKNFQTDDVNYQDSLLASAFFQNKSYSLTILIGEKILLEQADYKPILKLLAKSYYEIGDWKQTKYYLVAHNKLDNNDPEISYFLAIVQEKLEEYLLSIIHFQKALKSWASNSLDIRKRLVYSYYELDEIDRMLQTLRDMVAENIQELTQDDFSFIIYHHIDQTDIKNAKIYSIKAHELFPDSVIIKSYLAWILSDESQIEASLKQAESLIKEASLDDPNHRLVLLVQWNIALQKEDFNRSFIYFKKSIGQDRNWEFTDKTKKLLEILAKNKAKKKLIQGIQKNSLK